MHDFNTKSKRPGRSSKSFISFQESKRRANTMISFKRTISCIIFLIISVIGVQFAFMHHVTKMIQSNRFGTSAKEISKLYEINKDPDRIIDAEKDPIVKLLKLIGMDEKVAYNLPTHDDFIKLYGENVVIDGLDTCKRFRDTIPESRRQIGPAGIFNTGTNLLSRLLAMNCVIPNSRIKTMKWQVPWGKHTPAQYRHKNVASIQGKGVNQTEVLPVVTIKDPYTWMQSMCRHSYTLNWRHHEDHCPNLMPSEVEFKKFRGLKHDEAIPVKIRYSSERIGMHQSLAHTWNDWNNEYFAEAKFPKLIVRFEDVLIHPQEVVTQVCECAGGIISNPKKFRIVEGTAKYDSGPHTGTNSLIPSLQRYGNAQVRANEIPLQADRDYAKEHLDKKLMERFKYNYIS